MRLQSRRVNTSLVGKLLKDSGRSERKGRGQVSMLRVGCRQGRTPCSACLLVLFLPPHQLAIPASSLMMRTRWGPEEGLDTRAWQMKGARSQYLPVREPQGSTPARGAPLQPGTLQAFHLHLGWAACAGQCRWHQLWPGQEWRRHQPGGGRSLVLWTCKVWLGAPSPSG